MTTKDYVEVQANVLLLDPLNFNKYQLGYEFSYKSGGYATRSPVKLKVPYAEIWYLVVDLGGEPADIRCHYEVKSLVPLQIEKERAAIMTQIKNLEGSIKEY